MADCNQEYVQNDSLDASWITTVTLADYGETLYSGLLMIAQAMRGGAVLEAPDATAWITMAVPLLLNTE
jgi:hypothetical protein